jgi:hypothetical protein
MAKARDKGNENQGVLTPGGVRPKSKVHRLKPGEIVTGTQGTVNESTVLTPGGYRHPSLVHRLGQGEGLTREGGVLRKLDLASKKSIALSAPTSNVKPALGSGWITDGIFTNSTGQPFSSFTTIWRVPAAPASQSGQTIFLFNALMDSAQNDILQPVLQWGPSSAGSGNFWQVACWFIDTSGNAFYHDPVPVNPGDTLIGVMTLTGQSNNLFSYDCVFQGMPATNLTIENISQLVVASETLECYAIQQCSDYPDAVFTAMTAIDLRITGRIGGINIPISWGVQNRVIDCGQHTAVVSNANPGGEVDLYYRIPRVFDHTTQLVTSLSRTTDHVDLFVIGFDNAVWSAWWDAEHDWSRWFQIHPETVFDRTKQRIAALARTSDHVDLFVIGFDNAVWSSWWDAEHNWQPWFQIHPETVFDHTTQEMTALARTSDHVDLFVIGFDNAVWSTWWDAQHNWQPWFQIHPETVFDHTTQQITALARTSDHVDLFVIGFDNAVWSSWWDAEHNWQPWFQIL